MLKNSEGRAHPSTREAGRDTCRTRFGAKAPSWVGNGSILASNVGRGQRAQVGGDRGGGGALMSFPSRTLRLHQLRSASASSTEGHGGPGRTPVFTYISCEQVKRGEGHRLPEAPSKKAGSRETERESTSTDKEMMGWLA
ncbi:hypothetical protein CGRA01v4_01667 [Colletotrichum graminicola]|nr:hypothetical protein CGRA01v4_01667 [Colletotrichum graminicola]